MMKTPCVWSLTLRSLSFLVLHLLSGMSASPRWNTDRGRCSASSSFCISKLRKWKTSPGLPSLVYLIVGSGIDLPYLFGSAEYQLVMNALMFLLGSQVVRVEGYPAHLTSTSSTVFSVRAPSKASTVNTES